jgi:hypothetical protein
MSGPPKDYVDVAERIRQFKAEFPEGTLQSHPEHPPKMVSAGDKAFIVYCAVAYRNPSDERPGIGWAWEPVPGPTPFTRDSELMNAETSAWGRAIVALGFDTKHVASSNEVQNRQSFVAPQTSGEKPSTPVDASPEAPLPPASEKPVTKGVLGEIGMVIKLLDGAFPEHPGEGRTWADVAKEHAGDAYKQSDSTKLTLAQGNELREWLEAKYNEAAQAAQVPFG